ncbi:MAG: hypothetical protein B7Z01_15630 [Brevundimonas subvibrioides]|uniref:Uncharacterized protein n=1 Tax=Brevundimonas subvibrioides TaxID=74313 RepID=A0A258FBQ0_9CAUL|nr:MAG: hypothetical protein B7Z01_15630 [Brevundimonas subvibrioides]
MRGCRKRRSLWLAGVMAAAPFAPVRAQEAPSPVWALEGETGVVSDYRYRGASLSDEASAWQAGLTVSRPGGLYGDLHVSTIAAYGGTEDEDGAHIEAALTLGWAGSLGDFAVDAAVATYQYPGGVDVAYAGDGESLLTLNRADPAWQAYGAPTQPDGLFLCLGRT